MEQQLTWKTKLFNSRYQIFQSESLVGELKKIPLSRSSRGELNGKKIVFSSKGIINQEAEIIDSENNVSPGKIIFSSWRSKATISHNNTEYDWRSENLFGNKWSIRKDDVPVVEFKKLNFSGEIEFNKMDEVLILAGLFIRIFFWERDD